MAKTIEVTNVSVTLCNLHHATTKSYSPVKQTGLVDPLP